MSSKRIHLLCLSIILSLSLVVEGQFFTKPSSKSIPRMGRSSQEPLFESDKYRQFLINELLDNYGPNLMEALLKEQEVDRLKNKHVIYTYNGFQDSKLPYSKPDGYMRNSEAHKDDGLALEEQSPGPLGEMLRQMVENH